MNEGREDIPDEYDGCLDSLSLPICCSFNRCGTLLAVGCNDGRLVIWDFLTRRIARNIPAHAGHPVSSMSWSRKGYILVTASLDNSIAVWSVLTGECKIRWLFKAPILKVRFNPRNDNLILISTVKHAPIVLKVDYETKSVEYKVLPIDKDDAEANMVASFDRRGQHIYAGGVKGRLTILKGPSKIDDELKFEIVSSFRIQPVGTPQVAISEIEFGPKDKDFFLINSSDRAIRLYSCDSALKAGLNGYCEELRKFQDIVNKMSWKRCCFSGEERASYVCGGSARQHTLYIWDTETGAIRKMLHGTKGEKLLDLQWHPSKPIVASVSGDVTRIWARAEVENWSAYAPNFQELEENEEYDERESEFDLEDEDKANQPESADMKDDDDEEILIDIEKPDRKEDSYQSSDEEDDDTEALEFIPVSMEDYEMAEAAQALTH